MVRVRYMHRMTSRDMMRLTPRSIMQLVGRLHFHLSFIVDNRHCCHCRRHLRAQTALNYHHLRHRHLRAQTALLGTTCMLVREIRTSNLTVGVSPHYHYTNTSRVSL